MPAALPREDDPAARRSARMFAVFGRIFERRLAADLRALRLPHWGLPPALPAGRPVIVLANHPSWWDGVAFIVLMRRLFPDRRMFVPMDAAALRRYPFMARLGAFGVETGTSRGAATFLRVAGTVLQDPAHMLWVNAPGRFSDARERPVPVAPGVLRLPALAPDAIVLPLALEYPFWGERAAEMLAAFGPPVDCGPLAALPREAVRGALETALAATMDRLAEDAISRDAARFHVLLRGQESIGGIYALWGRVRATVRGERYDPRHLPAAEPAEAAEGAAASRGQGGAEWRGAAPTAQDGPGLFHAADPAARR